MATPAPAGQTVPLADVGAGGHSEEQSAFETSDLVLIGIAVLVAILRVAAVPGYYWIALGAVVACGYPIYREALESLRERRMTMELSMTIALVAAMTIGEVFTALMIVLFVLVAEVIEGLTVGRGRRAIKELLDLLPQTVDVRAASGENKVRLSDLRAGDVVVVRPGGRIPVDGMVVAGGSFVDQSAITGEPMPVEKTPGAEVFAGTVNQSGALEVEVRAVGGDTAFGRIVEAVETAERSRAPIQKTADRLAGYLVYFALACATLTFLLTHNARSTISVIIVAGACGIAAGTPLAILGGIGSAARAGVIVKGGLFLETLGKVNTVVLDKTGTLTEGRPRVVDVIARPGATQAEVLREAAIAEALSEHSIAEAVREAARQRGISFPVPDTFSYTPGRGVTVTHGGETIMAGNRTMMIEFDVTGPFPAIRPHVTEILVAKNRALTGTICIADSLRPEAVEALRALRKAGLQTILLSGDAHSAVQHTAGELALDIVMSDLLPVQKSDYVAGLTGKGDVVAMLGDGINDAPALRRASIGIAMGSGTDIARESADALLLGDDLGKFVETLHIARRCRRIIMTNFAGTLLVDAAGVALAAFGYLNPLLAVTIHVSSELAFILNSARLLPRRR
ncbi:MAG: cation-translocating P-type ATPase [Bryobacteraceae bacterium]|jgi:Cd2+/Zn2+-exporting ATPase/Cu+-exporting ATPase